MRSPERNHELRELLGNAATIYSQGESWGVLGETMSSTAAELTAIGDSSVHKSKGTDKLAELATESAGDLKAAGIRYTDTAIVLRNYATALEKAQLWIHPRIEEIEAAELAYQAAEDEKSSADRALNGLDTHWPWEDEPTPSERTAASTAASTAGSDLVSARGTRDELWKSFDTTFDAWSDAYDDAVDGIQKAMDTAGNNNGFWEFVDDLITVIGVVLIVLTVIALIVGAPFTGLLALVMVALTLASLALTLLKFAFGRATLSDVAWSAVGLLPFGIGKVLSKGAPALSTVIKSGRTIVTGAIRSGLPKAALRRPNTWFNPVKSFFAPLTSRLGLPKPGVFTNWKDSMRLGGANRAQVNTFLTTMSNSRWGSNPAVGNYVNSIASTLPGRWGQAGNVGLWTGFMGISIITTANQQPAIPFANTVRISR